MRNILQAWRQPVNNNTVLFFFRLLLGSAICPCIPTQQIMLFNEK
jgi:hypothetical protein